MRVLRSEVLWDAWGVSSHLFLYQYILFCLVDAEWVRLWLLLSPSQTRFIIAACERGVCRAAGKRQSWRGKFFISSHNFGQVDSFGRLSRWPYLKAWGTTETVQESSGSMVFDRFFFLSDFVRHFCLILTSPYWGCYSLLPSTAVIFCFWE